MTILKRFVIYCFRRSAPNTSKDVKPVIKKEPVATSSSTASAAKIKQEDKKVSPVKNQKKTSPAKKGDILVIYIFVESATLV